jgi:hypothetical protein
MPAQQPFPARVRPWLAALAFALAIHAWLLGPRTPPVLQAPAAAMQTRLIAAAPRTPRAPDVAPRPVRRPVRSAHAAPAPGEPAAAPLAIAPSATWLYRLRQNGQEGWARLNWQVQEGSYHLQLDRQLGDHALPGRRSTGQLGPEGLAPIRYAVLRGQREAKSTNFRRDEGLLSHSAGSELAALPDGVQDPVSWWLQLAALVTRHALRAGQAVRLPVAGLRGEAVDWVFECLGAEDLPLPKAAVTGSLHLRRAALGEWDGVLDLWLDPARDNLPVRLQSGDPATRGWELILVEPAGEL